MKGRGLALSKPRGSRSPFSLRHGPSKTAVRDRSWVSAPPICRWTAKGICSPDLGERPRHPSSRRSSQDFKNDGLQALSSVRFRSANGPNRGVGRFVGRAIFCERRKNSGGLLADPGARHPQIGRVPRSFDPKNSSWLDLKSCFRLIGRLLSKPHFACSNNTSTISSPLRSFDQDVMHA